VSEDMQDGEAIEGMRIANPFRPELSRVLGRA
jgi:predicted nucleic acid-binding protein